MPQWKIIPNFKLFDPGMTTGQGYVAKLSESERSFMIVSQGESIRVPNSSSILKPQ